MVVVPPVVAPVVLLSPPAPVVGPALVVGPAVVVPSPPEPVVVEGSLEPPQLTAQSQETAASVGQMGRKLASFGSW